MGLVIKSYRNKFLVDEEYEGRKIYADNGHSSFNERLSPLTQKEYYSGELLNDVCFQMSYGGVYDFRVWLIGLLGLAPEDFIEIANSDVDDNIPFMEFLLFPDSFGIIGSDACKKLLVDFKEHEEIAMNKPCSYSIGFMQSRYKTMIELLEWAVQDGFIEFN